jgi:plasmid stabilization system protein ParE
LLRTILVLRQQLCRESTRRRSGWRTFQKWVRDTGRRARHVRVLLYGHYRIAYLVKDGGDIDILGVFHGALDINKYQL